ncbi:hypothetical protein ACJ5NV_07015 [Loktanella agnita]|uniref:hypothetical protein n=1 Tax=Loktanella agnita TaxID=287097 RepID=UPI00398670F5
MSLKTIILAAAASATVASAAAADTYFQNGPRLDEGTVLELGLITADNASVVEIYDYHAGQQGALLGTEMLNAGANPDVRVNTGGKTTRDVLALVKVGSEVVATKSFDIN